jgi:hypothetical protein
LDIITLPAIDAEAPK